MFCKNLINHCKKLLHLLLKTRRVKELSKESTPWKESPTRFSRMFLHCTLQWLHQNILICTPIILQIKVKNIYKMNFSVTIFLKKLYQLHYSNSIKLSKYHTNSNAVATDGNTGTLFLNCTWISSLHVSSLLLSI